MSLFSDGDNFSMRRPVSPEMLYENTFSDTDDDDDDVNDDVKSKIHQADDEKQTQLLNSPQQRFSPIALDHTLTNPNVDNPANGHNPKNVENKENDSSNENSGAISKTPSPQLQPFAPQPARVPNDSTLPDSAPKMSGFSKHNDNSLDIETLSEHTTPFGHFLSNWALTDDDLKCFPFKKSTNSSSSVNRASRQPPKQKKKSAKIFKMGSKFGGMRRMRMMNMSPYAMIARMAEKQGYDLTTYLETLEFTGASTTLPCMQCYENNGGMMAGSRYMTESEYVEEGKPVMNGRCASCGGQVHTMVSYGVMLRKLRDIVTEKDFIPHDVYPDGNCLFAAVIDQLHVHSDFSYSMHSLRLASVEYIRNNPCVGDGTPIQMFLTDESLEAYLERMSLDGEWGDHIILSAVANVINMVIYIYGGMSGQNETIVSPKDLNEGVFPDNCVKNIFLGHIGESHYFSLRPRNWKENSYEALVNTQTNKLEARYPMQYFNFILSQISRTDSPQTEGQYMDQIFSEVGSRIVDEIAMEPFGGSVTKLVRSKTETDSISVDIGKFFPSAKVVDVTQADGGIFMFNIPQDTNIVYDLNMAEPFDLIVESQKSVGLFKLVPATPDVWEGQTICSTDKFVYLKNIELPSLSEGSKLPFFDDMPSSKEETMKLGIVLAFKSTWPNVASEWVTRSRPSEFPNSHTLDTITSSGCHVIPLKDGVKMGEYLEPQEMAGNDDAIWCYSFVSAEKEICRFISSEQQQCYFLFRSTASMVPGEHGLPGAIYKSIFFYSCENILGSTWISKPAECFYIMLKKLAEGLNSGFIPHYFMYEKNLLDSIDPETIKENQKMLSFARYQPVTSLYFLLDSMNLMSSEVGSFVEQMIQDASNIDPNDDRQTELITRACTTLLGDYIADEKYQNAMLVFNSLIEQTVLNADKSVEILEKQLSDVDLGSKWCFALYMDIRQKSLLSQRVCHGKPMIHISELLGPDCKEELPDTCLPECFSIQNGNVIFMENLVEVLQQCVSTKVHAKCMKFYLKRYSEIAGDALVLPNCDIMKEMPASHLKYCKSHETCVEQQLYVTLENLYVGLFSKYNAMNTLDEFKEMLPTFEQLVKASDFPYSKKNLWAILKYMGLTSKAAALKQEMGNFPVTMVLMS